MFRYKTNKQAFIIAALVIMLCLVCLVGATLALFTNDPNDGTIGIITTTGNVDVDIVDAADESVSLVGGVLEFQTVSTQKEIFFEPGAQFYTQGFKIKNLGDIPINFRIDACKDLKDKNGDPINMEEFNEAFELLISDDLKDPNAAKETILFNESLEAGESSKTYYLIVKMKETAGDEFQSKTYRGIGINVYAVQGNVDIEDIEE